MPALSGTALNDALEAVTGARTGVLILCYSIVLGLALGALGAADTERLNVLGRTVFWVAQVSVGAALCLALEAALRVRGHLPTSPWLTAVGCGLAASVLYTPFAWQLEVQFGLSTGSGSVLSDWLGEWRQLVLPFVLCWILLRQLAPFSGAPAARTDSDAGKAAPGALRGATAETAAAGRSCWSDLPPELGQDVVWVKAEEHYLSVATTHGRALIRSSLQKAIAGPLNRLGGMQVHRSYWVAAKHVRRLLRSRAGWVCEMDDGERIPVSRRRRALVKKTLAQRVVYPQPEAPAAKVSQSNQ